jgi:membrane fusion protein, macrolide-specific efflux system
MVKPARLDMMTIKSQISEADIPRILLGQEAYFTIFSDPNKRHDIEVRTIEPASETTHSVEPPPASVSGISNASVYYNAQPDVPNPVNRLLIGMTTEVSILLDRGVLLVPFQAVHNEGNEQQVMFLTQDQRLVTRKVITSNLDIQTLRGLKPWCCCSTPPNRLRVPSSCECGY